MVAYCHSGVAYCNSVVAYCNCDVANCNSEVANCHDEVAYCYNEVAKCNRKVDNLYECVLVRWLLRCQGYPPQQLQPSEDHSVYTLSLFWVVY